MAYATISGVLKDADGIAWRQAIWTAVPVSPSSKPVFPDGSPVPSVSGTLDNNGTFSGQVPQTLSILPPGTTLTITIGSLTTAPAVTITKVQITAATVDLGALLSARIAAPRIAGAAIAYAYDAKEITNPKHGNGYVNTTNNRSFLYMTNTWQPIGSGSIDPTDVAYLDQANHFTQTNHFLNGFTVPVCTANPSNGSDAAFYVAGGTNEYLVIDSPATAALMLNWDSGTGGVIFGDGQGRNVAHIDSTGRALFQALDVSSTVTVSSGVTFLAPQLQLGNRYDVYVGQSNSVNNAVQFGIDYTKAGDNIGHIAFAGNSNAATFDTGGNWIFENGITGGLIPTLPDGADLNTVMGKTGSFRVVNPVNGPATTNGSLMIIEVISCAGPACVQRAWAILDTSARGSFWQRVYDGSWEGWLRFNGT